MPDPRRVFEQARPALVRGFAPLATPHVVMRVAVAVLRLGALP